MTWHDERAEVEVEVEVQATLSSLSLLNFHQPWKQPASTPWISEGRRMLMMLQQEYDHWVRD